MRLKDVKVGDALFVAVVLLSRGNLTILQWICLCAVTVFLDLKSERKAK